MATAYFMQLIIEMTEIEIEQDHIEMIIYNCPSLPDRTKYIIGESSKSPLPGLIDIGRKLALESVDIIAIPCITAHYFYKEMSDKIKAPIINGVEKTAEYLKLRGYQKVGIMATSGTVAAGIFTDTFVCIGIECIYPSESGQQYVMEIIYDNVKLGHRVNYDKFKKVSDELFEAGAELILLGCTELSVVKRDCHFGGVYLDVLDVLAQSCVKQCAVLKDEYEELIVRSDERTEQ